MSTPNASGIYFFLGAIPSHVLHALPLYRRIGGTFVVTSRQAARVLEAYNIRAICLDDVPYLWKRGRLRPYRDRSYVKLTRRHKRTINYLKEHARVVIFYEIFEFVSPLKLDHPTKLFLTHGNMLKNYMAMQPWRIRTINEQYDYMAALGPYMHEQFIQSGVDPAKLVKLGIARSDEVRQLRTSAPLPHSLARLGITNASPIVSYLPTYWGESSVDSLGLSIAGRVSDQYQLLIRPHPQTPKPILDRYRQLTSSHVHLLLENDGQNVTLLDILSASDLVAGDLSSVMLEALLLDVPLVFVDTRSDDSRLEATQLDDIYSYSQKVTRANVHDVDSVFDRARETGIDRSLWATARKRCFYQSEGSSTAAIADFVSSL